MELIFKKNVFDFYSDFNSEYNVHIKVTSYYRISVCSSSIVQFNGLDIHKACFEFAQSRMPQILSEISSCLPIQPIFNPPTPKLFGIRRVLEAS